MSLTAILTTRPYRDPYHRSRGLIRAGFELAIKPQPPAQAAFLTAG